MTEPVTSDHLLMHISDALALDGRVGELGLEVRRAPGPCGERIVVSGCVSTEERKRHVVLVAAEVLAEHGVDEEVVDETEVPAAQRPDGEGEVVG